MERLEMFFTDDYSLVMYHSSKSDKKSNIMRKPPGEPMVSKLIILSIVPLKILKNSSKA